MMVNKSWIDNLNTVNSVFTLVNKVYSTINMYVAAADQPLAFF